MKKNIVVGLHTFHHDGSIFTLNLDTGETRYLKFERISEVKGQKHNDLYSWVKYLNHIGYSVEQVVNVLLVGCTNLFIVGDLNNKYSLDYRLVDHHVAHLYSGNKLNGLVIDDVGSQLDSFSIFKKRQQKLKLDQYNHSSLGKALGCLWNHWFLQDKVNEENEQIYAGHTMALHYISKIREDFKLNNFTDEEVESFVSYIKGELGL